MQAKTGTDWLKAVAKKIGTGAPPPINDVQAASLDVERWLQSHEVAYAPPAPIPMHLVDEKRSRQNQARRDPIVNDSVERFAVAMKNGVSFPPIVVFAAATKVVIIDGNNRQAAARKAGLESIMGIVVADDTPGELIRLLTVEANAHHGVTPDLSWRLQQAFSLCSLGFNDQQAADAAGVSVTQIRTARQIQDAEQRARALKISGFADLPSSSKQALAAIKDEAVFFQAAKVAISTGMTTEQIRDMTRAFKTLTSEGARIEYVGNLAKERGIEAATRKAVGKAMNRVSSPKTGLVSGIGLVLKVDEAALIRNIVTRRDKELIQARVRALEEKVLALQIALEKVSIDEQEEDVE